MIQRAPVGGGAVETIAGGQRMPGSIEVRGDRVWWSNEGGPALLSAKITGGDVRKELGGRGGEMDVDDSGAVIYVFNGSTGYVIEKPTKGPAWLRFAANDWAAPAHGPPHVAGDWLYTVVQRTTGGLAILAIPRDDRSPQLVVRMDGQLQKLKVHDGIVYWYQYAYHPDGSSSYDLWRGDPSTGARTRLTNNASGYGYLTDFVPTDDGLYIAQDQYIYKMPLSGGDEQQFATATSYLYALSSHREHLFWIDGPNLMAKKRSGSQEPFPVATAPGGYGYGAGGDIVFDDDYAYLTNFGTQGIYRVSERGKVTPLYTAGQTGADLVRVGDELYFTSYGYNSTQSVIGVPLDDDEHASRNVYAIPNGGYAQDLVEGGGSLFLTYQTSYAEKLVRLDPSTGDAVPVMTWQSDGSDTGQLAVDESAVYAAVSGLGAIVRIPLNAPAMPDLTHPAE